MDQTADARDAVAGLIGNYTVPDGVADEMIGPDGRVRPVWQPFIERFAQLAPDDIARRFARGDRYLRDAGVFFRQSTGDGPADRDWPLSHLPVILDETEWLGIADGLVQRCEVLEQVLADLYGPGWLVREGMLPPELVAGNPGWLRPLVGERPPSGRFLHFVAFELGRAPDGSWFVLGDRTEAPSGAGFALENRVATMRVFSEPFGHQSIHRLAGFFRAFRSALERSATSLDGRMGILTPGLGTETYFEHAYIARYLGLMLLEGEDLTVVDGRVMVRTVAGLKPVSVLWRRLDSAFADPLELDERSALGTPGLVRALRDGNVCMANALGAGLVQSRAFLAFLPRIARYLTGESLKLPNLATWWCGQARERDYVAANLERMMVGDAMSQDLPFEADGAQLIAGRFRDGRTVDPAAWVQAQKGAVVGQEAVTLSTTPVYADGALHARPVMLRVFAARTNAGWKVMPGGYARIGGSADATALALRRGGRVADVWIVSDRELERETLTDSSGPFRRAKDSLLPARAADNLLWLGRYVERAETMVRLLRAYHLRLAETGRTDDLRVARIDAHLRRLGVPRDVSTPGAVTTALDAAIRAASKVRDRFSIDGWVALETLRHDIVEEVEAVQAGDEAARALSQFLRGSAGFAGLVHDNMYRFVGWRFLSIGRALERALSMVRTLRDFAAPDAPEGCYDIAIEMGDSVMTHRRRYQIETNRNTVIDLLALDNRNPRSVRFQVAQIHAMAAELPGAEENGALSPVMRAAMRIDTRLATAEPAEMDGRALDALARDLTDLSEKITATWLV
ncbi:circularly permuted type 2 ATP-grasp protein [Roseivivax jejudonensis]